MKRTTVKKLAGMMAIVVIHAAAAQTVVRDDLNSPGIQASNPKSSQQNVLILTKGQGGDANGASALREVWGAGKISLFNLAHLPLRNIDMTQYSCIFVVGQGAADDFAELNRANLLPKDGRVRIGIYSHLLDDKIVSFLGSQVGNQRIDLFVTQSQFALLKIRNRHVYEHVKQSDFFRVWTAPLAIETVAGLDHPVESTEILSLTASDNVIWLGGNYATSQDRVRVLSTAEIVASLRRLVAVIKPNASIAIILMPRLFEPNMHIHEKRARLVEIRSTFGSSPVTFYGSQSMAAELGTENIRIVPAPPYAQLMRLAWSHARHFASVDQFNLFADLKHVKITPFLLDPLDADQALYAADYLQSEQSESLSREIEHRVCGLN